ncbi:MAG TPA: bifunctional precorrin-2 dehydrogenase/sirohydrochlorin ferrochelatase [Anaerohalosphaeraceae bacterium]|nr:bifunctional precorrin-2 dehydrogenase/sirohydrochlorin ferrochelatase [Anaerohalosphaeraceae bacterium]
MTAIFRPTGVKKVASAAAAWYDEGMAKYPIYLELSGRRAVVVGGGAVAVRKVQALQEAGARVIVVAEYVHPSHADALRLPNVELIISPYRKDYLAGSTLAIAATNDPALNEQIFHDCQELEVLCNVVDKPELCDFYTPAVVKRGDLQIAVCTEGDCPAYAGHIRRKLEELFTETHGHFVKQLEKVRQQIIMEIPDADQRKSLMGLLASDESFEIFRHQGQQKWNAYVLAQLAGSKTA